MTGTTKVYPRPQDKHGLLLHRKTLTLNRIVGEVEMIFSDYYPQRILDCACVDGLYAAELAKSGRQVFAADESKSASKLLKKRLSGQRLTVPFHQSDLLSLEQAYPETFDAILCLDSELARYENPQPVLRALFDRLNENGILVLGIRDMENLPYETEEMDSYGKDAITPLLLGGEYEGRRCSILQTMRYDRVMGWVMVNIIYHVEDPDTGTITVDWDEARFSPLTVECVYDLVADGDWYLHTDIEVEGEHLFVCGKQLPRKCIGPASYFQATE